MTAGSLKSSLKMSVLSVNRRICTERCAEWPEDCVNRSVCDGWRQTEGVCETL